MYYSSSHLPLQCNCSRSWKSCDVERQAFACNVLVSRTRIVPLHCLFPCKLQWSLALPDSKPYHKKQLHRWQQHIVCLPVGRIRMGMAIFFAKYYVCKSGYQLVSVPHLTAMPKGAFSLSTGVVQIGVPEQAMLDAIRGHSMRANGTNPTSIFPITVIITP